jgi:hypothetical protein
LLKFKAPESLTTNCFLFILAPVLLGFLLSLSKALINQDFF